MPLPSRHGNPRAGLRALTMAMVVGAVSVGPFGRGGLKAQHPTPFAWPHEITFERILEAERSLDYDLDQIRRILDTRTGREHRVRAIKEHLRHRGRSERNEDRFSLDLMGPEGRSISPQTLEMHARTYSEIAPFLYHFHGCRIDDPVRAAENYRIVFLGLGERIGRAVYRVAVFSPLGGRSGWLLELDFETGYPLYRAEYHHNGSVVSEIEVTRFDPNYSGPVQVAPDLLDTVHYPNPQRAARSLDIPLVAIPDPGIVPKGFAVSDSKVITEPRRGTKIMVLTFSDGIDRIFLMVNKTGDAHPPTGHTISAYRDAAGQTECLFVEGGHRYIILGSNPVEFAKRHLGWIVSSDS